ncbi:hypothetical protein WAX74_03035 [Psychrobacillus sp. FJAT-51614]|uniref:Uncharacterized protein n=1 Tax=Psychrobacillus mangrovi TaxID=3117745 RepID=A0ABU8F0U8_9BACI
MKKEELHNLLINSNVPPDSYNLNGGLPNEAFCLNKEIILGKFIIVNMV